jgi:uncharacterized membrane protein
MFCCGFLAGLAPVSSDLKSIICKEKNIMLWVIIGILTVIVAIIYFAYEWFTGYYDGGEFVVASLIVIMWAVALVILFVTISSAVCDATCDKTWYTYDDTKIYALQDDVLEQGRFFLGSGYIDSRLKYFYVEDTEIGYVIRNVNADNTYIQYTDGEYHMETQSYKFNHWLPKLIAIPFSARQIFYIPEGSIVQNYTIDLQ